jgi:UDP-glucuronate decarboxylase
VDRFIQQALANDPITVYGDGKQTRSFTYVTDSIEAMILLIRKGKLNEIYNIGNDRETRIIDLAEMVRRICRSHSSISFSPIPDDEPKRRSADITKIRNLGFSHMVDLESGIKIMKEYMQIRTES